MITALFLFYLHLPAEPAHDSEVSAETIACDDGAPTYHEDGTPNWSCRRGGCGPSDAICWADRLAHCDDGSGGESKTCTIKTEECTSRLSCFNLWVYCTGTWECKEDGGVGCKSGTCDTDNGAPAPQSTWSYGHVSEEPRR